MYLNQLKNGDQFKVIKVILEKELGKRLVDMGFSQGVEGIVIRCALLGDPVQIRLLSYDVSLRVKEASGIEVELITEEKK